MSRKIRLKRGNLADLPQLELGEPGVATDDGSLYIGTDRGNVRLANQDDLDGVNQQLADKLSKGNVSVNDINKNMGKLDQTYLADDLLQQIAGEAPINAVPADESITIEKMAFPALSGIRSKNLYNKDTAVLDKGISPSTGGEVDAPGNFLSDYIRVEPSTSYVLSRSSGTPTSTAVFFYNGNQEILSYVSNTNPFQTPTDAKFLRLRGLKEHVSTYQLEVGGVATTYTPFGNLVDVSYIPERSIGADKIAGGFPVRSLEGATVGKNLFDKNNVTPGKYIISTGGLRDDPNRSLSDYIKVKPSTYYTLSKMQNMAMFDDQKNWVSGFGSQSPNTFMTPENVHYMRIGMPNSDLETFQLEEGQKVTAYEPFGYRISTVLPPEPDIPKPFLKLRDAVESWYKGEKFPVGFFGDSQTDGNSTTGFVGHNNTDVIEGSGIGTVDYHAPNAYPKKLEEFIQEETNNPNARIYNIGYSGHSLYLMLDKREELFSHAYSDTKMVGIVMGTNDRNLEVDRGRLESRFKKDLIEYVEWFYSKGIQPFIVTSQASVEPDTLFESQQLNQLRNKKSEITHAVINRIKKEVAKEYDLELIDMSAFGELYLTYSQKSAAEIVLDKLHFKDAGHLAEAGYIFSQMFHRVVEVDDDEILSFTNQKMRSEVSIDHVTMLETVDNGFKVIADYTKGDTADKLILDFWVLNKSKTTFTLNAYCGEVHQTYVVLNGQEIPLTTSEQSLDSSLDIGLHHIQVFSGESNEVDFKGFKLMKNSM